jgi:hypothetical protein
VKYPADFAQGLGVTGVVRPTDIPDFRQGRDIRVSAGYVVRKMMLLRAQYTYRRFDFANLGANLGNGIWNQRTHQITGGVGLRF